MKTIRITRGKEKAYDEHKIKVYINNNFVGKLKQNETKEFQIQTETIEIVAKTLLIYKSPIEKYQCEENSEIEIKMNPSLSIHPILIIFPFIPIYIPIMTQLENLYLKIAASVVLLSLLIWSIIQSRRVMKRGILISKK